MPLYGSDNDLQHDKKRRDREAVTGDNKKKNRRDPSYDNVQKAILPMDIWERILCFLGVPDLGRCALVSKEMSAIAKNDVLWKHHVIKLRETAFGDFFYIEPERNSSWRNHVTILHRERTLKSISFRIWFGGRDLSLYIEIVGEDLIWKMALGGCFEFKEADGTDIDNGWLVEDVPLRSYYKALTVLKERVF